MAEEVAKTNFMRPLFIWAISSLLFCACISSAHQTETFKKMEQSQTEFIEKLSQNYQQYSEWEGRERHFLTMLNLNQTKAYSNYKDSFIGKDLDQVKVVIAYRQMSESFSSSPQKEVLLSMARKLVNELITLNSKRKSIENFLNDIAQMKDWYLKNR